MTEDEEFKERQRLYERTRDQLAASDRSVSESYDRSLLTLSSAFLGGSLAVIGQVIELHTAALKWILYVSWLLFTLTIIVTLTSFLYGLFAHGRLRDAAERYYMRREENAWKVSEDVQRDILRLAVAYGVSFLLGIVLLVAFVLVNLVREPTVTQRSDVPERLERSIPPSTFQKPASSPPAGSSGSTGQPAQQPTASQPSQQQQSKK